MRPVGVCVCVRVRGFSDAETQTKTQTSRHVPLDNEPGEGVQDLGIQFAKAPSVAIIWLKA